jgi:hypothetical protein
VGNVGIQVLGAGLTARWVDGRVFDLRTGDLRISCTVMVATANLLQTLCRAPITSSMNSALPNTSAHGKSNSVEAFVNLRILIRSTRPGSIPLKVIDRSRGILSKITKIKCFSTLPQQQQPVENLEEFRRRLVNPKRSFSSTFHKLRDREVTHVQRIACPLSAKVLRKLTIAQAL